MASCELPSISLSLVLLLLGHICVLDIIVLHMRTSRIYLLDSWLAGLGLPVGEDPLNGR